MLSRNLKGWQASWARDEEEPDPTKAMNEVPPNFSLPRVT